MGIRNHIIMEAVDGIHRTLVLVFQKLVSINRPNNQKEKLEAKQGTEDKLESISNNKNLYPLLINSNSSNSQEFFQGMLFLPDLLTPIPIVCSQFNLPFSVRMDNPNQCSIVILKLQKMVNLSLLAEPLSHLLTSMKLPYWRGFKKMRKASGQRPVRIKAISPVRRNDSYQTH